MRTGNSRFRRGAGAPIKRADAEAVAGQEERVLSSVVNAEGELALEMFEHPLAVLFPKVGDQFRVGRCAELMALRFQCRSHISMVKELAVKDAPNRAILVADWLFAVGESNDGQTSIGEAEMG
jgi:hypothetical protein